MMITHGNVRQIGLAALVAGTLSFPVSTALGQTTTPSPTTNSIWYYEIGGAAATRRPAHPTATTVKLTAGLNLRSGLSCGKFDPKVAIENSLNRVASGLERMYQSLVGAASAAIANLPMLILQRVNPGLYDLLQNALLRAEEEFTLAVKSCELLSTEIADGKNPFDEWVALSKGEDWKVVAGTGGISTVDAVEARRTIETNSGVNGVTWIGGTKAGGVDQEVIAVIGDTAHAGFNILNGRAPATTGPIPAGSGPPPRIVEVWPSPEEAAQWITEVVGDTLITTCDECDRSSAPGKGLMPKLLIEQTSVADKLRRLVTSVDKPTLINLEAVSPEGIAITREVIEAIQGLPSIEREFTIDRLAGEVAQARIIERVLLARRMLLTGEREPNIVAQGLAADHIENAIAQLDREVDNMLYETRAKREIVSTTALTLLRKDAHDRSEAVRAPSVTPVRNPNPVQEGAVTP